MTRHQSWTVAQLLHFLQMKCFPATVSEAIVLLLGYVFFFQAVRIGCDHTIFSQTLTCSNLGTRQLILPHQTKEERPEILSFLMFCDKQAVHPKMDRPVAHMLRDSLQCKLNRNTRQRGIHIKESQRKIIFLSFMAHRITFLFVDRW